MKKSTTPMMRYIPKLFLVIASMLSSQLCNAITYDLTKDWSNLTNPNDVWTYREGTKALPFVSDWIWLGSSVTQPAWAPSVNAGNFLPAWFQSTSNNPSGLDVLAGDIVTHTTDNANGSANGPSNVIWTSPSAGSIDISGSVWLALDRGRSNTWSILLNDVLLTDGTISSGDAFDRSNPFTFAAGSGGATALQDIQVSTGDEIRLELVRGSTFGEFVGVDLQVTLVPLPASVWLFGSGLIGMIAIARKKKA